MPAVSHESAQESAVGSFWPDVSLLGVVLIWGINIPVFKLGLDRMDWYSLNAIRLAVSVVVLNLLAWHERGAILPSWPGVSYAAMLRYSVLASGIYQLTFLLGIARAASGNVALIIATVPMWTALMARIFLNERLARVAWAGLVIAFVGTLVVTIQNGGFSSDERSLYGNVFMLCAALSWAGGTVASRPVLKQLSPLQLSAFASLTMLPFHVAIAAPRLGDSVAKLNLPEVWVAIAWSGIFSTGFALAMWNYGVSHAGAAHAAVFQNLVPVIAMTSAWLVRGEPVTMRQLVGGTLIIGGLLIMRRGRIRRSPD
ncbi:MAG: DMT family transporter [Planctomycetaceae bacterium]